MPVRVALVEDNPTLRRRLVERFRFFEAVEVLFVAPDGESCLDELDRCAVTRRPQVMLMDIELPGISGIETTARLRERYPEIDVLMLTVFEHEEKIFQSIQAGASGYLLKDTSTEVIVKAVEELVRGGAPMSPVVARKMLALMRTQPRPDEEAERAQEAFSLSNREMEILQQIVQDETEPQIAETLHISPHTVRTHIKNIYKKLHVHSRASAVRVALEQKLFRP